MRANLWHVGRQYIERKATKYVTSTLKWSRRRYYCVGHLLLLMVCFLFLKPTCFQLILILLMFLQELNSKLISLANILEIPGVR
jgi:hypothetical protein